MISANNINDVYRPSASLILAGRYRFNPEDNYDYKLLLVKRAEQIALAPDHCVFPGGVFDASADESADWLTYFYSFGVTKEQLELLHCQQTTDRPYLMTKSTNFSRNISLRLTALRETFEEAGLLLCRERGTLVDLDASQPAQVVSKQFDRELWQQLVHNDAKKFLQLCRHLDVVPDLWALSEWSIWRTAATADRKYDTVYYFAALETIYVQLLLEPSEVIGSHWLDPQECWYSSLQGIIWLPFMLLYETARLSNVGSWLQLLQFAWKRGKQGSTLYQPVYYRCENSMFGVLPGDDLYVDYPHTRTRTINLPGSMEEWNALAKNYNRYIAYNFQDVIVVSNIESPDGHLPLPLLDAHLARL